MTPSIATLIRRNVGQGDTYPPLAVIGTNGGKIVTSADGQAWTVQTSAFSGTANVYPIIWVPDLALFVAFTGTGKCGTSPDGITWTNRTYPASSSSTSGVAWSSELGLLMTSGPSGRILSSPDAITWSTVTNPIGSNGLAGMTYAKGIGKFVAVTAAGVCWTTVNGSSWASSTIGTVDGSAYDITWSESLKKLLVSSGRLNDMRLSSDGITWTTPTGIGSVPNETVGMAPTWLKGINKFMHASASSIALSSDGNTWTITTPSPYPHVGTNWQVGSLNSSSALVCGKDAALYTTPNGSVWTPVTGPAWSSGTHTYSSAVFSESR